MNKLKLFLIPVILLSFAFKPDKPAYLLYNQDGKKSDYSKMIKEIQDADIVFGIYRNLDRSPLVADLICLKHRNGPIGTVMLAFREELTSFADMPE